MSIAFAGIRVFVNHVQCEGPSTSPMARFEMKRNKMKRTRGKRFAGMNDDDDPTYWDVDDQT